MTTYVEYQLDDGSVLLVEIEEHAEKGIGKASRDKSDDRIISTGTKFVEALKSAKVSTLLLLDELKDLPTDEMEITFGLKSTGEAGIFAIGKIGLEANYEVKVKWKRQESDMK